ncbi:dihydroorotase [Halalkalicoccus jeotgali]|uniref:Dihydroorotase n=1 Tax=Halalkalicoccus jeotgali (strain DSM 18796 / CECT 7217 / JCM 14584 / KCTC 4019 / B3) TaxID=795797 RepID=D8J983_HALJB|nr:dihydroorotase [Halalkalicoccus jeotgali]ADJ16352.1 dihydroorotase [Halalkalicoccus jeotgali B3]ELY37086.1 dihydroorotase [Halalkalicoccus jeotgali B3]
MLITNATLADGRTVDVRIEGERIGAVKPQLPGEPDVDATGKLLMPGAIDAHVHFREPGFPHKETWETGSQSAAAGGVTTVVDQPNTDPPTVDGASFDAKAELARESYVDYGINGGVTEGWDPDELFSRPVFALGEVFLADSTGEMGIGTELFERAVERAAHEDTVVTVHAEDATRFDRRALEAAGDGIGREGDADAWSAFRSAAAETAAVELACEVGARSDAAIHIAHTSTPEGIDAAVRAGATCEVCPHHLFLSRDDLEELGTLGRMNPPLRSEERREAVFERVRDGTVDIVATDHAPHTREEKEAGIREAPSGVPGVETMVPLLLAAAERGEFARERVRDLVATNPARVFCLPRKGKIEEGMDADLALYDPDRIEAIHGESLHSKADWTPFEGHEGVFPELTLVRGTVVYDHGKEGENGEFGRPAGRNVRR